LGGISDFSIDHEVPFFLSPIDITGGEDYEDDESGTGCIKRIQFYDKDT
jgi:hypothetical protein